MASLIQIKRSIATPTPTSLANGELAYSGNTASDSLFVGNPNGGAVTRIGGKKFGHVYDAAPGTLTANATIITDANSLIDTLKVGNTSVNSVINATTVSTSNVFISGALKANGTVGSANQVLYSNGTVSYWADLPASSSTGGSNTQIQFNDSGGNGGSAGLTFDKVTNTFSVSNTISVGGTSLNSTVYVGTSNNTNFVGSVSAANVVSNAQLSSNLSSYQTTAGLAANVQTLTSNNTSFVGTVSAANVVSNAQLSSNLSNYQTTAGLSSNVAVLTANNANFLGGACSSSYQLNSTLAANVQILTANNANNFGGQLPAYYTNATNLSTGTLNTDRLPATVNVNTSINVGNVAINTTTLSVGNSAVNTIITGNSINVNGQITTGQINLSGDILPVSNATYSLGNTTNRFKDLFLSGSTLTIGNTTLSTATGDLVLSGGLQVNTGATFSNTISVTGNASFTKDITVNGNTVLGDGTSDVIQFVGRANSDLIPSANVSYDLGTEALSWRTFHANLAHVQYINVDKDLVVAGNLTVTGTLATINVQTLAVTDPLIQLASNNTTTDTLDIGFFGSYQSGADPHEHTGLFRDATDGVYKLFDNLQPTPATTVDTANATFRIASLQAYLSSGALTSNSTTVTVTANSTVNVNITANTLSLSTALLGTSGGTGLSSYTAEDILVANSSNGFRKLGVGSEGYILQVSSGVLAYGTMDGGTF